MKVGKSMDKRKDISQLSKKKITLQEIENFYHISDYKELAAVIKEDIKENKLKPIKTGKINGKNPPLFVSYWIIKQENQEEQKKSIEELKFLLEPMLHPDYYLRHLDVYKEDRNLILQLNQFLKTKKEALKIEVSMNERSFQIWGKEKFLKQKGGKRILKNLGILLEDLHIYETAEPPAYYSHKKETPQNILILENSDTFYSMRKYLLEGNHSILGLEIGTLIYGGGKKVRKAFLDFSFSAEPYLREEKNTFFYFGDFDYEGIAIFMTLKEALKDKCELKLFRKAYERMIEKMDFSILPITKEGQRSGKAGEQFFYLQFSKEIQEKMKAILEQRKYIPQEILNRMDF